jgi:hypothetical protein
VAWLRGVPLRRFARAVAPAQGIAISSRSSLAALPALIDGAAALGRPGRVTGFFLPFDARGAYHARPGIMAGHVRAKTSTSTPAAKWTSGAPAGRAMPAAASSDSSQSDSSASCSGYGAWWTWPRRTPPSGRCA